MTRAPFISLDGLDGCGKTTQCRLLAEVMRARGWEVVECADPGGTAVGQILRSVLLDAKQSLSLPTEAFLFMASRAQLVSEIIRPALETGKVVISDRFLLANIVYQGHAGGLDIDTLWTIGHLATGGVEPDLTLVLDLPLAKAMTRRKRIADRMESRGEDYFAKVRAGFLAEAERRPERIQIIDATLPPEDVHAAITKRVIAFVEKRTEEWGMKILSPS